MNKNTPILVLSFALLAALVALPCVAQTSPADQAASQASSAAQAAQDSTSQVADASKVQERLQKLSSELNLTDDQKAKIKPILQNEVSQAKTVRNDNSLSADQRQAQMKDIHSSAKSQINEILTPDQQKKLAAMRAEKGW